MKAVTGLRALPLVAVMCVMNLSLHAQSIYGGLRGSAMDAQGSVISEAKVTMIDESTAITRSTITNAAGEFNFASVTPSTFTLVTEAPGFKRFERKGVVVATQQFVTLDVKLEVGQVTESVMVTEEVPLLETSNASQGQVIDRQKLIDLPNLGRNPFMMSRLAPTVVQVGNPGYNRMQDQSGSSQISINGGPVRGNNYLLDGVPITDFSNRAIIIPSLEAVSEMKVQTGTYDAEMGRTGGGVFNTYVKSGGNTYHGSLLGYMRQTDWLANTFFNNRNGAPITDQPFRNYGGSFGGPVIIPKVYNGKNKTFFWLGFEGYRDTQAASREQYTPTALERTGNFSQTLNSAGAPLVIYDPLTTLADGSRTPFPGNIIPAGRQDTVGKNIAATYMPPTKAAAYYGKNNLAGAGPLASKADQQFGKLDQELRPWWRASLSYLHYNSQETGENPYPTISSPDQWYLFRKVDTTQVNTTLTPTSTWVMTFRYGFNRFPNIGTQKSQNFPLASLGFSNAFVKDVLVQTFPNVTMSNAYSLGTNNNFNYVHHSKNFGANASKYLGRHSLKFGYDFRRLHADGIDFQNSSGAFTFDNRFSRANSNSSSSASGADIADMLLGAPAAATGYIPTKLYEFVDYHALYVQDDFRLSSKLTLNFGLRWERETGLRESNNNLITGFDPTAVNPIGAAAGITTNGVLRFAGVNGQKETTGNPNLNKWSPRIGAAYQWDAKTVIRGGWGLFWAPAFSVGSPFNTEGITANTQPSVSNDGNKTPAIQFSNPFPNGLDRPVGNTLGALTGIGKSNTIFDPNATSTRVQQFSLDIQRQLAGGFVASVGYSGSRTANLTFTTASLNIDQLDPQYFSRGAALNASVPNPFYQKGGTGSLSGATVAANQLLRPYPQYSAINLNFSDRNRAQYDSAVVKVQKAFSQGFTLLSTYTFSKNFDMSGGGAGNNLNAGNSGPQDVYSLAGEWGLSNVSAPHRWTNAITYELPFGKGKRFLGSANYATNLALGGWSINTVSTFQSGYPLQIYMNTNGNSSLGTSRQRPNATGISPAVGGSIGDRIDGWINKAAFVDAPAFTMGNVSRTIPLQGPRMINWDISMFKTFDIFENFKAQFRAEALNAMNTPYFRGPNTAWGNGAFGQITSQGNFPRMLQLGLRLYFLGERAGFVLFYQRQVRKGLPFFLDILRYSFYMRLGCNPWILSTLFAVLANAQDKVDFIRDVQPIFRARCVSCHGAAAQSSGLRLDRKEDALRGGYSGPVLQPANSASSRLYKLISTGIVVQGKTLRMPPGGQLPSNEAEIIRRWIDEGAVWPAEVANQTALKTRPRPWSFLPLRRDEPPMVRDANWVKNPIDAFVLAKLENNKPSPEAPKTTLIRRLSLDLIGLLPNPEETADFLSDDKPGAYERLVDRLLQSEHYGEKWARPWLDLARFADSEGGVQDYVRPYAWRYREWVIQALNRDMPFDQFTIAQMAGDLLPNATLEQKLATGFHRNTVTSREGGIDLAQLRFDQLVDRANTVGTAWLGLTVGCAQCHDHKYDPITQKDYYRLMAFFENSAEVDVEAPVPGEIGPYRQNVGEYSRQRQKILEEYGVEPLQTDWESNLREAAAHPGMRTDLDGFYDSFSKLVDNGPKILHKPSAQRTERERQALTNFFVQYAEGPLGKKRYEELHLKTAHEQLTALREKYPQLSLMMTLAEETDRRPSYIRLRGNYKDLGAEVTPGIPESLGALPVDKRADRLALARWLVLPDNPLTARVAVNRSWQEFFGRGLSRTPEDFGMQGEKPTHPELLDWLASQLIKSGWSMKTIHRLIVTSATYRQSSRIRPDLEASDPGNTLLARQSRVRLPAELIRDAALSASGLLLDTVGGESVRPPQPEGVTDLSYSMKWVETTGRNRYRRGIYVQTQRTALYPLLGNFDVPDRTVSCARREISNTPLQALNLMNDPLFTEAAQALTARLLKEPGTETERIDRAFQFCYARPASAKERDTLASYLARRRQLARSNAKLGEAMPVAELEHTDPAEAAAWFGLARALLNTDEFITRE